MTDQQTQRYRPLAVEEVIEAGYPYPPGTVAITGPEEKTLSTKQTNSTAPVHGVVMCGFGLAWRGPCENPKPCSDHTGLECDSCGSPATHQCDQTMGPCVCGCNLCDECEHEIAEDGTNGGNFNHCRKDSQKYKPWYMREST